MLRFLHVSIYAFTCFIKTRCTYVHVKTTSVSRLLLVGKYTVDKLRTEGRNPRDIQGNNFPKVNMTQDGLIWILCNILLQIIYKAPSHYNSKENAGSLQSRTWVYILQWSTLICTLSIPIKSIANIGNFVRRFIWTLDEYAVWLLLWFFVFWVYGVVNVIPFAKFNINTWTSSTLSGV